MKTKIDVRRAIKERFGTIKAFADRANMCAPNIIQNIINGNPSIKKLEELWLTSKTLCLAKDQR